MRRMMVAVLAAALLLTVLAGCKKKPAEEALGPLTPQTQAAMDASKAAPPPQTEPPPGEPAGTGSGNEQLREVN